jgi:hypothetical protein
MEIIDWKQVEHNLLMLNLPTPEGKKGFIIDPIAIGFLVTTRIVYLHVKLNNQPEQVYTGNFAGLKPLAGRARGGIFKKLKITTDKVLADTCAIARGESYADRWLTTEGWNECKFSFNLAPAGHYENLETNENVEIIPEQVQSQKTPPVDTIILCPSCKAPIKGNMNYCGICGWNLPVKKATPDTSVIINQNPATIKPITQESVFRTIRYYSSFLVFNIFTLVLLIVHFNVLLADSFDSSGDESAYIVMMSLVLVHLSAGAGAYFLALIYRSWRLIQDGPCRTNPSLAAWLLMVPIFNFVWAFTAIYGLASDMNKYYHEKQPAQKANIINAGFASFFCIIAVNMAVWFLLYLFISQENPAYNILRTGYYLSLILFFILIMPLASAIKKAYKQIAVIKQ